MLVVIILILLVFLVLIPRDVRAAFVQGNNPGSFVQVASAYPDGEETSTDTLGSAYPIETGTPPTAAFGNTTQTATPTATRTLLPATGFVTATSSYANTAAAIATQNALTLQAATINSPLYTPVPTQSGENQGETATFTSDSLPSLTPSPSITSFPTLITTPRVLERGASSLAPTLKTVLIGLGSLGVLCLAVVGFWYFRKRP